MNPVILKTANIVSIRATVICLILGFITSVLGDERVSKLASQPVSINTASQPAWSQNLRLIGVTAVGSYQTAYFADSSGVSVFSLEIGETLPGEALKLERIENPGDSQHCRVVLSRGNEKACITINEGDLAYENPINKTMLACAETDDDVLRLPPVERIAVRPWKNPSEMVRS